MLNCCMSGLSSALGCTFESVISSEKALACTSYLAAEVVHAARAAGFQLTDTNGLNTAEIADFQTAEELERSKGYIYRNYYPCAPPRPACFRTWRRAVISRAAVRGNFNPDIVRKRIATGGFPAMAFTCRFCSEGNFANTGSAKHSVPVSAARIFRIQ